MTRVIQKLVFIAFLAISCTVFGQDGATASHSLAFTIPNVAMVDVEGANSISLSLQSPTEAGQGLGNSGTNNTLWLNYSSTTHPSSTNSVKVRMEASLPGLDLKITASADVNEGEGETGSPSSTLTLSTSEQNLINSIGTCYTGDGTGKGHNLTYVLEAKNYSLIEYNSSPNSITIIYTISNN